MTRTITDLADGGSQPDPYAARLALPEICGTARQPSLVGGSTRSAATAVARARSASATLPV